MRIAVYAFDGITMFHLAAPLLVFGEVGRQGLATGWGPIVWTRTGTVSGPPKVSGSRTSAALTWSMRRISWSCPRGRLTFQPRKRS